MWKIRDNFGRVIFQTRSKQVTTLLECVELAVKQDADLRGADLRGADLEAAELERADLEAADMSGASLGGAELYEAKLMWAKLEEAKLERADLFRANLKGANLKGANLRAADLSWASLEEAILNQANLRKANLSYANLKNISGYVNSHDVFFELCRRHVEFIDDEQFIICKLYRYRWCWDRIQEEFGSNIIRIFEVLRDVGFGEYYDKYKEVIA